MASTSVGMGAIKKINTKNLILDMIRSHEKISKFQIKKLSKFSMSTVLSVIEELQNEEYIIYSGTGVSKGGRKPVFYSLNPKFGFFIGVEFNAEYIYIVALDFKLNIILDESFHVLPLHLDSDGFILKIYELIDFFIFKINSTDAQMRFLGIGIGAPGSATSDGISGYYPHISNWNHIPLKKIFEKKYAVDTYIENNINLMTLPHKNQNNKNTDFLLFSIRSGMKMACVLNNTIYKGISNNAGEIGHTTVYPSNRMCQCGRKGCLESEASNQAIISKIIEGVKYDRFSEIWSMAEENFENISIEIFIQSVVLGHSDSLELFNEVCYYIGTVLAQTINLLNPSIIYLRGTITKTGELLINALNKVISEKSVPESLEQLSLEISTIGANIGAIGAAIFVMQNKYSFVEL